MQLKVQITLEVDLEQGTDTEYYLDKDGTPSLYLTADLFDILDGQLQDEVIRINDKSREQVRAEISAKAGI